MRRSTTLVLCLAALPLLAPSKPLIDNEGHAFFTDNLLGGRLQQFQFRSAQWGPAPAGGGANEMRMNDTAGGVDAAKERQAGTTDIKAETDKGSVDAAIETQRKDLVAQDRMGNAPTGRYLTMRPRPLDSGPGTLVVTGSLPGCAVGKRYGGMQFASGGMRYELKDVVISNCPTAAGPKEEITFVYGTVKVKGWDPKKKED